MVQQLVLIGHVLVAVLIVVIVLLQRGKGAEAGTGFGAGASATVFGSRGSANFFTRTTAVLAVLFFATSLTLAYFAQVGMGQRSDAFEGSVLEGSSPPAESREPAVLPAEPDEELPDVGVPGQPAGEGSAERAQELPEIPGQPAEEGPGDREQGE